MNTPSFFLCGCIASGICALFLCGCDGANPPGAPPMTIGPAGVTTFVPEGVEGALDEQEGEGNQENLARRICNKLASCFNLSSKDLQTCEKQFLPYRSLIFNVSSFEACFQELSCSVLFELDSFNETLVHCMNIESMSLSCHAGELTACTSDGACRSISCQEICASQDKVSSGCGNDRADPKCICRK